jgi:hypothetical protein
MLREICFYRNKAGEHPCLVSISGMTSISVNQYREQGAQQSRDELIVWYEKVTGPDLYVQGFGMVQRAI